ncbi:MAG: hypothetical protein QF467_03725 [SAR202 cluster bacterium]|nr:hypothetical protein [SAR202 cluster bacterium]
MLEAPASLAAARLLDRTYSRARIGEVPPGSVDNSVGAPVAVGVDLKLQAGCSDASDELAHRWFLSR